MARPAQAVIDLTAIRHNYRLAKSLAPNSRALAIVKGNGYGHGAVPVARALAPEADGFGVACIEEALELRAAGINHRLVLLEGFFTSEELALIDQHRFDTTLHSQYQIDALLSANLSRPVDVWLKMDSGMHRLGFTPEQFLEAYRQLRDAPQVGTVALMSHFSRADEIDHPYTRQQLERFLRYGKALECPLSLSNSPAILAWPDAHQDWIRPGMMLYGASPLPQPTTDSARLEPAMELRSAVIAVRELEAGETIGYGSRYICTHRTRVGVVAMGYADGFPRHAPNGLPVLVGGKRSQLIGRVSMDMLTVDLTNRPDAGVGTDVVFWGRQVPVELIADKCDTIPYELVSQLTPRVPRVYTDADG